MNKAAINPGTLVLPQVGNDWLENCRDMYILINPLFSSPGSVCYYNSKLEATFDFFLAGLMPADIVLQKQLHYNDGINCVAVPMTKTALNYIESPACYKETGFDVFASVYTCLLLEKAKNPTLIL